MSSFYLTPPTSPSVPTESSSVEATSAKTLEHYHKHYNIQFTQSSHMPNASKIKHGSPFSWQDINFIIYSNQLEIFARSETQTIKYHSFKKWLKENELNINEYLLQYELHWKHNDIRFQSKIHHDEYTIQYPQDLIFHNKGDIKIKYNKFPYYFEEKVKHLCIWSKLTIPTDKNSEVGDISKLSKQIIEKYLHKTFVTRGVKPQQIVWFKNWLSLQSVRSISHIHVILYDVDDELIEELLEGDGGLLSLEDYEEILA